MSANVASSRDRKIDFPWDNGGKIPAVITGSPEYEPESCRNITLLTNIRRREFS